MILNFVIDFLCHADALQNVINSSITVVCLLRSAIIDPTRQGEIRTPGA